MVFQVAFIFMIIISLISNVPHRVEETIAMCTMLVASLKSMKVIAR